MYRAVAVSCRGVSKSFALIDAGNAWRMLFSRRGEVPVFKALNDVNFEVPKGQFVGILGRNGAGKSTLLRVTGGVYPPDSGTVSIEGALSALYELGLVAHPEITGRQYADRVLKVHAFSASDRKTMIADIQDFSELGSRFEDPILTYSAGMGARLFFSVATAGRYDVYLLDEVLAVGDMHFQSKCWRRLRDRVARGASGVLVTHDWSAIAKLCQTAYVLERGNVSYSGPAEGAARFYLYGEAARERFREGVARFPRPPCYTDSIEQGQDFHLSAQAEILVTAKVTFAISIEQLQPGYGWETTILTRRFVPVGGLPGLYDIDVRLPNIPLEPGSYRMGVHLIDADPEPSGQQTLLDGFGWTSGTGLLLTVTGSPHSGLNLPTKWSITTR